MKKSRKKLSRNALLAAALERMGILHLKDWSSGPRRRRLS